MGWCRYSHCNFCRAELRFLIVLSAGIASMVYGLYRFSRELILPVLAHSKADKDLVQIVAEHRFGLSQPEVNVVAIGGGTGLATLLRGLKRHDVSITAIVTVADDGGSTGKIRTAYDIPRQETSGTAWSRLPTTIARFATLPIPIFPGRIGGSMVTPVATC